MVQVTQEQQDRQEQERWEQSQQRRSRQSTMQGKSREAILAEAELAAAEARARVLQGLPPDKPASRWHKFRVKHGMHNQDGVTYDKTSGTFAADYRTMQRLDPWWEKFEDLGEWNEDQDGPVNQRQRDEVREEERMRQQEEYEKADRAKKEKTAAKERERAERRAQQPGARGRKGPVTLPGSQPGEPNKPAPGHPYVGQEHGAGGSEAAGPGTLRGPGVVGGAQAKGTTEGGAQGTGYQPGSEARGQVERDPTAGSH